MNKNKQPYFGNDRNKNEQPYFGDGAVNNPGNNGYGFEEHEQFVDSPESESELNIKTESNEAINDTNAYIVISAGHNTAALEDLASKWYMKYAGTAAFDDGEPITEEHKTDITSLFYKNTNPSRTAAFIKTVNEQFPDVNIMVSNELSPDAGDDLSRFGTNNVDLSFDGLDDESLKR